MAADPITIGGNVFSNEDAIPIGVGGVIWSNAPPGIIPVEGDEGMRQLATPTGDIITSPSGDTILIPSL